MAVNTVFPKGLLTFECANGVTEDVGRFRWTSLWQACVPGRAACLARIPGRASRNSQLASGGSQGPGVPVGPSPGPGVLRELLPWPGLLLQRPVASLLAPVLGPPRPWECDAQISSPAASQQCRRPTQSALLLQSTLSTEDREHDFHFRSCRAPASRSQLQESGVNLPCP